jgi:hypothetical protein
MSLPEVRLCDRLFAVAVLRSARVAARLSRFQAARARSSASFPNFESSQRFEDGRQMVAHASRAEFEVGDSLLLLPVIDSPRRNIDRSGELKSLQ